MRLRQRSLCLASLICFFCAASAAEDQDLAQRLYRDSGMEVQIAALPLQYAQAIAQSQDQWGAQARLPKHFAGELGERVKRSFDLERFRGHVLGALSSGMPKEHMEAVLTWLSSPVGQRMTQLEEASSTATPEHIIAYRDELAASPPAPAYLEQVQQLMNATNAVESAVEVGIVMQLGIVAAAVGASPNAPPDALSDAIKRLEAMRPQFETATRDQLTLSFLFTYRNARFEDLAEYVAFATSDIGSNYHRVAANGMAFGIRDVSLALGREIAGLIKQLREQKQS